MFFRIASSLSERQDIQRERLRMRPSKRYPLIQRNSKYLKQKVSSDQRMIMVKFMEAHPELVHRNLFGPLLATTRRKLWAELATSLNACATGPVKTMEKWAKCWRDWRCDVKGKWEMVRHSSGGTEGPFLIEVEERLMQLLRSSADIRTQASPDPSLSKDTSKPLACSAPPVSSPQEFAVHSVIPEDWNPSSSLSSNSVPPMLSNQAETKERTGTNGKLGVDVEDFDEGLVITSERKADAVEGLLEIYPIAVAAETKAATTQKKATAAERLAAAVEREAAAAERLAATVEEMVEVMKKFIDRTTGKMMKEIREDHPMRNVEESQVGEIRVKEEPEISQEPSAPRKRETV